MFITKNTFFFFSLSFFQRWKRKKRVFRYDKFQTLVEGNIDCILTPSRNRETCETRKHSTHVEIFNYKNHLAEKKVIYFDGMKKEKKSFFRFGLNVELVVVDLLCNQYSLSYDTISMKKTKQWKRIFHHITSSQSSFGRWRWRWNRAKETRWGLTENMKKKKKSFSTVAEVKKSENWKKFLHDS